MTTKASNSHPKTAIARPVATAALATARKRTPLFLAFAVCPVLAAPLAAQEYCVACTEPEMTYRCVIDGARPGAASSLQLLCISALAKEGSHATCAVRRGVGVIDCNGAVKHVSVPAEGGTTAASGGKPAPTAQGVVNPAGQTPTGQTPAASQSAPAQSPAAAQGDPKTVAEMLKRAKDQSDRDWQHTNETIKSNNEKVGSFFKKSWDCMASLFARCGDQ